MKSTLAIILSVSTVAAFLYNWTILITLILMIEKGFPGTGWLSETVTVPFIVFQLISVLKNASMAGFLNKKEVNYILDKIDKHKGVRS
jgi:phage-related holin